MEVVNPRDNNIVEVILRKNKQTPSEMLGVAVMSGGKLQNYCGAYLENDEVSFDIDKTNWLSGVYQIVLFNSKGEIICDRLVFNVSNDDVLDIKVKTNKPAYFPFELAEMEISVADREANPVNTTFSLSVRDGANEVENGHNILTDLLLMSEIKGYVRNASYYFGKSDEEKRHVALDILLMVQGWRRYSWSQMTGIEPLEIKHLPEKGLETTGQVVSLLKPKPQPNIDISVILTQRGYEDDETGEKGVFYNFLKTDENGRFSFLTDVEGKWSMILTLNGAGKKKDHDILLDRVFSPKPRKYNYSDLKVNIVDNNSGTLVHDEEIFKDMTDEDYDEYLADYQDSLTRLGLDKRTIHLQAVTVTAKRKVSDIVYNRSTSVAYYDVQSEYDDLYDKQNFVGKDIHKLLKNMDNKFYTVMTPVFNVKKAKKPTPTPIPFIYDDYEDDEGPAMSDEDLPPEKRLSPKSYVSEEFLMYNNKYALVIVNYKPINLYARERNTKFFGYQLLRLPAIKSIYINEDYDIIDKYITYFGRAPQMVNMFGKERLGSSMTEMFGCVVFIETFPDEEISVDAAKGVRKTWFNGYSKVDEYYHEDHSDLPPQPDPDYRRTLYWNPSVKSGDNGKATVKFYNNSSCKTFKINAETVTSQGGIGVFQQ